MVEDSPLSRLMGVIDNEVIIHHQVPPLPGLRGHLGNPMDFRHLKVLHEYFQEEIKAGAYDETTGIGLIDFLATNSSCIKRDDYSFANRVLETIFTAQEDLDCPLLPTNEYLKLEDAYNTAEMMAEGGKKPMLLIII